MIEFVLCVPAMFLLFALVVEAVRAMALLVVLDVATQAVAEDLALRYIVIEREGRAREGRANAPDLDDSVHSPLRDAVLSYVAGFPGYAPLGSHAASALRPEGELYVDRAGGRLEVRSHICVPSFFLARSGVEEDAETPGNATRARRRDCQGRFSSSSQGPTLKLESTSVVPLPAAYSIHERGLALPSVMPLVNDPAPAAPLVGAKEWGPAWDSLFLEAASLFGETPSMPTGGPSHVQRR